MPKNPETKVTFRVFNKEFTQSMAEMESSAKQLRKELKLEQEELKLTGTASQKLEATLKGLQQQFEIAQQKTKAAADQLAKAKTYYGENSNEAKRLENKLLDLRIAEQKLGNSIQETKSEMEKHGKAMQESAKDTDKAKKSVDELGIELENVAGALAAGGGIAGALDQALDTSSLNTKIDITLEVPEKSKKSVKEAIKGVEAYGIDAESALAGVRRQWALNKDASDKTNAAVVKGAAMIARSYEGLDFTEVIQETNEVASSLGISNQEALGLMNSLLKAGFPPEQLDIVAEYGTQLKMAGYSAEEIQNIFAAGVDTKTWNIDNLIDGIKEGRIQLADFGSGLNDELKEILSKTDISAKQFQNWGKEIAKGGEGGQVAMNEVTKALAGVKDETVRNQLGTKMFGTMWEDQGMKVVDTLLNAKNGTADLGEGVNQLNDDIKTTDADPLVRINNAISNMKIALEPVLTTIAEVVGKIADWAAKNPELAATIAAVVTGIGILMGIFLALAPVFITITGAAGLFNAAMAPTALVIGGIVLAIAAVIAIGVLLYKNWDEIKAKASQIWGAIKEYLSGVWNSIKENAKAVWEGIKKIVTVVWDGIKTAVTWYFNTYKKIITTVWNAIKTVTSKVWEGIKSVISKVWNGIKSAVSTSIDWVKTKVSNIWNSIKSTTSSVWNGIKSVINSVWNGIKTAVSTPINWIKTTVSKVWNGIKSTTTTVWNGIKSAITKPIEAAKKTISGIIDGIKKLFSGLKLKIPKISMPPLPHFKLSGSFSLKPPSVPKLSVDWYANGGYFDKASVIGIGEAGPEMALPLIGKRMAPFADAVSKRMLSSLPQMADSKMAQSTTYNNVTFHVSVRNDRDIDKLAEKVDTTLEFKRKRRKAAWGG